MVTPECIEESDYRHLEDIQVYWGRGKNSKLYPAKQFFMVRYDLNIEFELQSVLYQPIMFSRRGDDKLRNSYYSRIFYMLHCYC